jgi:broad specificity phosphatase PhoE
LLLIRHGQTEANINRLLVGLTDVPLDPIGEVQARRIGEHMRNVPIDALVTSPLKRARDTAHQISLATGKRPEVVPGLSEMNFGRAEGLTLEQVIEQFPELITLHDDVDDAAFAWPGGDHRIGFHERVFATFLGIIERYDRQRVAVVCHGGVIGSFFAQIEGGSPNDFVRYAVANCSITHLVVTADHTEVHLWNDVSHLDEVHHEPWGLYPSDAPD